MPFSKLLEGRAAAGGCKAAAHHSHAAGQLLGTELDAGEWGLSWVVGHSGDGEDGRLSMEADDVWRRIRNTHKANMNHFWVAFEGYLRLIERKASIVEQHGLSGIPKALFES